MTAWDKAPHWATCAAYDAEGVGWWYEVPPKPSLRGWQFDKGNVQMIRTEPRIEHRPATHKRSSATLVQKARP